MFPRGVIMRLIDADKLVFTPIDSTDIPDDCCLATLSLSDIRNAKTIMAIPVEWLLRRYPKSPRYASERYKAEAKFVRRLIREWRESNE